MVIKILNVPIIRSIYCPCFDLYNLPNFLQGSTYLLILLLPVYLLLVNLYYIFEYREEFGFRLNDIDPAFESLLFQKTSLIF